MVSDDALIDGLLDVHAQLPQRTLPQWLRTVEFDILNTAVPSSCYLRPIVEVISYQLLELLPFLLLLIQELLILVRPLPLLKLQEKLFAVLHHTYLRDVSHLCVLEVVLVVLRGLEVFDNAVPQFHVDLQLEGLLEPRLDEFFTWGHFVLLYAFDHPGQALNAQEVYDVGYVFYLFLADVPDETAADLAVLQEFFSLFAADHQNTFLSQFSQVDLCIVLDSSEVFRNSERLEVGDGPFLVSLSY